MGSASSRPGVAGKDQTLLHIYVYIIIYIYIYTHMYYIYIYIHICVYIYIYMIIYLYNYKHMYTLYISTHVMPLLLVLYCITLYYVTVPFKDDVSFAVMAETSPGSGARAKRRHRAGTSVVSSLLLSLARSTSCGKAPR